MHIHIIGVGSIGTLIAFHLRRALPQNTRISLLLKAPAFQTPSTSSWQLRPSRANRIYDRTTPIHVERGGIRSSENGFEWEIVRDSLEGSSPIHQSSAAGESNDYEEKTEGRGRVAMEELVFTPDGRVRPAFGFNELERRMSTPEPFEWKPHPTAPTNYNSRRKTPYFGSTSSSDYDANSSPIESLFVLTKAPFVLPAIKSIRHRLTNASTIVLLQNGMGVYDELIQSLFRNAEERPNFIMGIVSHGAYRKNDDYDVSHNVGAGGGDIKFGIVPDARNADAGGRDYERSYWAAAGDDPNRQLSISDIIHRDEDPSSGANARYASLCYTVLSLLELKELNPNWLPISTLSNFQRAKIVQNSIINPLTSILGCKNGDLFADSSGAATRMARRICGEAEAVFRAELRRSSGSGSSTSNIALPTNLTQQQLLHSTYNLARATRMNTSSMLSDILASRSTEINYLNGYLSRLGKDVGVPTPTIDCLAELIRAKRSVGTLFGGPVSHNLGLHTKRRIGKL